MHTALAGPWSAHVTTKWSNMTLGGEAVCAWDKKRGDVTVTTVPPRACAIDGSSSGATVVKTLIVSAANTKASPFDDTLTEWFPGTRPGESQRIAEELSNVAASSPPPTRHDRPASDSKKRSPITVTDTLTSDGAPAGTTA